MKRQTFMKSTLCLLMALVCNVAWAQVTLPKVSTGSEMHYYRIKSLRTGKYAAYTGDYSQLAQTSEQDGLTFSNIWYVTADGENYKLHNVSTDFMYAGVSSFTSTGATTYIKENPYRAGYVCVSITENLSSNCWDDQGSGTKIGNYNPKQNDNEGTSWTFEEITEGISYHTCSFTLNEPTIGESYTGSYTCVTYNNEKSLPLCVTKMGATLTNIAWGENTLTADIAFPFPVSKEGKAQSVVISAYKGANVNIGYIKYYVDGTNVKAQPSSVTDGYDEWEIYPSLTDRSFTFIIKNVGTGKYIQTNATSATHTAGTVTVVEGKENATSFTLSEGNRFRLPTTTELYLSAGSSNSAGQQVGAFGYTSNNGGVHYGVSNHIFKSQLPYEVTDAEGNKYGEGSLDATTGNASSWLSFACLTVTKTLSDDGSKLTATITFPFPVSKEGGITNATFIANWGASDNPKKWFPVLEDGVYNVKVYNTANSSSIALSEVNKWRWAIYPQFADGTFTYLIKNVHTGTYVYADPARGANAGSDKGRITLQEEGTAFTVVENSGNTNFAYVNNAGTTLKLTTNGGGDNDVYLGSYAGGHAGNHIAFSTLSAYAVTTDANGYAAIYTPMAVTIPDGVTVYKGNMVTANKASLIVSEVENITVIPANTAVIIKGTPSTKYTFNKSNEAGTAIEGNVLMGSANSVATNSIQNGVPYTLQADGTFTKHTAESIPGYNVYIKLPTGTTNPVNILGEEGFVDGVEDFVQGGVYTFVSSKGWMGATETCDNVISTAKTAHNVTGTAADDMFQWTVYKSNNGNYYLYNIGKQMFMGVQSNNQQSIPFVENPIGRKFTFKQSGSQDYPIMFSTDNAGVVNHNGDIASADGVFTWTGGWNNLNDAGSNHQVTLVSQLPVATLQEIANKVEAYDKRLYIKAAVEGLPNDNPNTWYGSVRLTNGATTSYVNLNKFVNIADIHYDGTSTEAINIDFFREYRGFELTGFSVGDRELGTAFEFTDELKALITAENPLIAHIAFDGTEDVTLFSADSTKSYRIPAIATTSTGRIIAVSDYRHNLDDIGRDNHRTGSLRIDLVMRYSDNNGKTWSPIYTIAEGTDSRVADDYTCAYGDAAIAVIGEKVLVMAAAGNVTYTAGSASKHNRVVRLLSEDNGITWNTKEDITNTLFIGPDATIENGYSAFFGSGKLAVDTTFIGTPEKPRIYGALLLKKESGEGNYVIFSDDLGQTWKLLGDSQDPVANQNEPKVEILPNGQILLSVRRSGGRTFNVFTYGDTEEAKANGLGEWNGVANGCGNGGNSCNGEIFCIDAQSINGTPVKLLLQSQPKGNDRKDVTIWYKEISDAADAVFTSAGIAAGWTEGIQVSHQLSGYSAMTLQEDGRIALFFEEAPCFEDNFQKGYSMVYIPLSIDRITKGNYFDPKADLDEIRTINFVLTDAEGNEYSASIEASLTGIEEALTGKYTYIVLGDDGYFSCDGTNYTYTNTVTLPFKVSNDETTVWHNIYFPANGKNTNYPVYMMDNGEEDIVKTSAKESAIHGGQNMNTYDNADKISWAIYQAGEGFAFKIQNKLNERFVKVGELAGGSSQNTQYTANIDEATAFELVDGRSNSYVGDFGLSYNGGQLITYSVDDKYVSYSTATNHQGGWVKIVEAPDFEALFAEVNAVLNMFGDGVGQYSGVSEENLTAVNAAKEAMKNAGTIKLSTLNDYKAYTSKTTGGTLNIPTEGKFFRIKAVAGWNDDAPYLGTANSAANNTRAEFVNDASSVFYYDGTQLISYKTGYYLTNNSSFLGYNGVQTSGASVTFSKSNKTGLFAAYNIKFIGNNSANRYLYVNKNNHTDAGGSANNEDGYCFNLEEVTELPFTISSIGYGTLWAPVALRIPDYVKAYTGVIEGDYLVLTKITTGIIPANTGVVIYRDDEEYTGDVSTGTTHNFAITSTTEAVDNNAFHGSIATIARTSVQGEAYTLQTDTESQIGVAFKPSATNIASGKAYLVLESAQQAQALRIRFAGEQGGTTEIEGSELKAQGSQLIYDLQGRRVVNPTKGMYIVNGKKVIVK